LLLDSRFRFQGDSEHGKDALRDEEAAQIRFQHIQTAGLQPVACLYEMWTSGERQKTSVQAGTAEGLDVAVDRVLSKILPWAMVDEKLGSLIAVGTALSGGPPHRSVLEELPHTAPALSRARNRLSG